MFNAVTSMGKAKVPSILFLMELYTITNTNFHSWINQLSGEQKNAILIVKGHWGQYLYKYVSIGEIYPDGSKHNRLRLLKLTP